VQKQLQDSLTSELLDMSHDLKASALAMQNAIRSVQSRSEVLSASAPFSFGCYDGDLCGASLLHLLLNPKQAH